MNFRLPLIASAFLLLACDPNVETRGALKDADWKEQIKIGTSTRDDVMTVLGSPSSKADFGPETWYYITLRRESIAFLKPDVTEQDVTRITFDNSGVVQAVDGFDKSSAQNVEVVSRITATEGHQLTFMEQLLGNLGRFNAPGSSAGGSKASRPGARGGR